MGDYLGCYVSDEALDDYERDDDVWPEDYDEFGSWADQRADELYDERRLEELREERARGQ